MDGAQHGYPSRKEYREAKKRGEEARFALRGEDGAAAGKEGEEQQDGQELRQTPQMICAAEDERRAMPRQSSPEQLDTKTLRREKADEDGAAPGNGKRTKTPGRAGKLIGEIIFYGLLLLLVIVTLFIRTTGDGAPRSFAGYSGMLVLTESMQSEIPKGSLVIAKQVDAETLQIGDDITYMANQTTTVTHRIIGIIEDYEDTGQRAFETQGVMNAQPDGQLVPAANVVGKVVFHSEALGQIAQFLSDYWPVVLLAGLIAFILLHFLERLYRKEE